MSLPAPTPDEATLRKFLLGTLPPEEAESVSRWAIESESAAVVLRKIEARDTVVDAIGRAGTAEGTADRPPAAHTLVQVGTPVVPPPAVGGFRVTRELGRGGMGVVLEAEDTHLKRLVAIKLIATEFAANPAARERFLREARAVAKIEHENVVPILHVGEDAGQLYLVMPLLKGETLDARLKRDSRLPVGELQRIGREVAAGLAAAHAVGLIHRDVKPANIWLEAGTGRVKLLDFGLAKPTEEAGADANLTDTGAVMGTPHYMSPEQAEGKPVDSRTDLFSLGAVLYHAATGQRPFKGETKLAVLIAVTKETPPRAEKLNTSLSPRVSDLLRALLEKDPKDRPGSATDVITELQDAPVSQAQPAPPARFPRWAVAAGLLAVAVLAAVVVVIIRDKDGKEVGRIVVPEGGKIEITEGKSGADIGKAPPAPATDPDRKAAEYVLSLGGSVRVNSEEKWLKLPNDLPKGPFLLTDFDVFQNRKVSDAGLTAFAGCKCLKSLNFQGTPLRDAGLAYFKDCKDLTFLDLGETQVSDAGLIHFKNCQKLTSINLRNTQTTELGLAYFQDCKSLTSFDLTGTRLSDEGMHFLKGYKNLTHLWLTGTQVTNVGLVHLADKNLTTLGLGNTNVSDAGLVYLRNCRGLTDLGLGGTQVSDAGLVYLKDCKNVTLLWLSGTRISDAGLVHIKDMQLTAFDLSDTKVSNAGLVHLKDCKGLLDLRLPRTRTTAEGLAELSKALPQCKITWDQGVIEPTAVLDADRKAAEYVLSVGGTVRVNDKDTTITAVADLPKGPFRLTSVVLAKNSVVTDAGLAAFKGCKNLTELNLLLCEVSDAGLAHFKGCTKLSDLDVSGTQLTDAGLAALATNDKLYRLTANVTAVGDTGFAAFEKHADIGFLFLNDTKLTDASLKRFANFKRLAVLQIDGTAVTDTGLAALAESTALRALDVRNTKVTAKGTAALAKALPLCRIQWDGGVIEPKK